MIQRVNAPFVDDGVVKRVVVVLVDFVDNFFDFPKLVRIQIVPKAQIRSFRPPRRDGHAPIRLALFEVNPHLGTGITSVVDPRVDFKQGVVVVKWDIEEVSVIIDASIRVREYGVGHAFAENGRRHLGL